MGLLKQPRYLAAALVLVVAVSFLAGSWYNSRRAPAAGAAGGRKILHYVDPMNPTHTSPEPGLAPCGMMMEPVYADDDGQAGRLGYDSRVCQDHPGKTAAHRGAGGPGGEDAIHPPPPGPGQGGGG